jgi:hypothetical protein
LRFQPTERKPDSENGQQDGHAEPVRQDGVVRTRVLGSLHRKTVRGHTYWQIVASRRVQGKPRPIVLAHLGKADDLLAKLQAANLVLMRTNGYHRFYRANSNHPLYKALREVIIEAASRRRPACGLCSRSPWRWEWS